MQMLTKMETGKLKVFSPLLDWFEEFRLYHRKDGKGGEGGRRPSCCNPVRRYDAALCRADLPEAGAVPPASAAEILMDGRVGVWRNCRVLPIQTARMYCGRHARRCAALG